MKKLFKSAVRIIDDIGAHQIGVYAASGAFFMFLSLVPVTALACSILPYTPLTESMVLEFLSAVMPESMHQLMARIVRDVYGRSIAALSLSALLTLWSASKAFLGLMRGLNAIYDAQMPKNYLRVRARSGLSILMLLLITVVSLALIVFERRLAAMLTAWRPETGALFDFLLNFQFVVVILLLTFIFMLMYKWMPSKKVRLVRQFPGALTAALLWMLLSWAFSIYFRSFGSYGTYGSLTTIIIAMMWMFYCMYIILLGAYVNTHLIRPRREGKNL